LKGLGVLMLGLSLASPMLAQQRPAAPPVPRVEPAPEPPSAYEPDMLRLAEVLGTLSYLTTLCVQSGSESWQQRMTQLLDAEGTTPQRKERLAGAYNRGYIGHQPAHRVCSERSRLVIDRLLEQGQKITRDLATRYSG
ncbi:MAG: TIGR02301 family protein, partial [Beijerinckiaceae bacterium]